MKKFTMIQLISALQDVGSSKLVIDTVQRMRHQAAIKPDYRKNLLHWCSGDCETPTVFLRDTLLGEFNTTHQIFDEIDSASLHAADF